MRARIGVGSATQARGACGESCCKIRYFEPSLILSELKFPRGVGREKSLRDSRRCPDGFFRRDPEGLPRAGEETASGSQPGGEGGGEQIQGSRGCLRCAGRCRKAWPF